MSILLTAASIIIRRMLSNTKEAFVRLDRPVPRYTSYPTAPHFKAVNKRNPCLEWMQELPYGSSLSLYAHIPFCPKLCWFCGCHTKITRRYAPVEDYLHFLLREINISAALLPRGINISNVHFGGGSPTMLRSCDFTLLMERIRNAFSFAPRPEIAIEIDPRQMSEAKAAAYARAGVTRASLGVQDFDCTVLESINRSQPFYATFESVKMLRDYGIGFINLDLMYGLPHQTTDTMRKMSETALLLKPNRIALFGYAHVPWLKKHMRLMPQEALPDARMRLDLFEVASNALLDAGYVSIGIDHFALPEDSLTRAKKSKKMRRNFQGYSDDLSVATIGLGLSAISEFPQGYAQNNQQMPGYVEKITLDASPVEKFFVKSPEDNLRQEIIHSLMCDFTADIRGICQKHGLSGDYLEEEMLALHPLLEAKLIRLDGYTVSILAPQAARLACAAFDAYLQHSDIPRHVSSS